MNVSNAGPIVFLLFIVSISGWLVALRTMYYPSRFARRSVCTCSPIEVDESNARSGMQTLSETREDSGPRLTHTTQSPYPVSGRAGYVSTIMILIPFELPGQRPLEKKPATMNTCDTFWIP